MSKRRSAAVVTVAVVAACSLPTIAPETIGGGDEKVDQRQADCDVAQTFLDVSKAAGPGDGMPFPKFAVTCSADTVQVTGNSVPHFKFVQKTEGVLAGTNLSVEFPRHPVVAEKVTDVSYAPGAIGITVGGTYLFSQTDGAEPTERAFGDVIANGAADACLGHGAPDGAYHAHGLNEKCLNSASMVSEPWTNPEIDPTTESPVIGYALDGFPIYGPRECADESCATVIKLLSSWEKTGDPQSYAWKAYEYTPKDGPEYLDKCNGHVGSKGAYHYHATSNFPYTVGCLVGTPLHSINDSQVADGGMPPPRDGGMPPPPMDGGMPPPRDGGMPPPPGDGGMPPPPGDGGMPPPPPGDGGMQPRPCMNGQTDHCCGDNVCDGPETAENCSDCP